MVTFDELQLAKLTIDSYKDQKFTEFVSTWTALFNPTELSFTRRYQYSTQQAVGASAPNTQFAHGEPDEIKLEFFFDGTGVVDTADSVRGRLGALLDLASYKSDTHRPYYVHLYWGGFNFRGVVTQADVTYTLFDRNGEPIRAKVGCTFQQVIEQEDLAREERRESADLHQTWLVGDDETLDLIAHRVYGDPAYWRPIAEVNDLANPRHVEAGSVLLLPPKEG